MKTTYQFRATIKCVSGAQTARFVRATDYAQALVKVAELLTKRPAGASPPCQVEVVSLGWPSTIFEDREPEPEPEDFDGPPAHVGHTDLF